MISCQNSLSTDTTDLLAQYLGENAVSFVSEFNLHFGLITSIQRANTNSHSKIRAEEHSYGRKLDSGTEDISDKDS